MKRFFILAVVSAMMMVSSCGTQKATMSNNQTSVQQQQQPPQRATRTMRTVDPCIALATEDSENLRAYGTGISYIEANAHDMAERDARTKLAQMLKVSIEGAAQDYDQNVTRNLETTTEAISESFINEFVAEEVKNTRIIKNTIYDLSDGSIQVYVCIEMRTSENDMVTKIVDDLSRDEILEVKFDRKVFVDSMEKKLDEYKKKERAKEYSE